MAAAGEKNFARVQNMHAQNLSLEKERKLGRKRLILITPTIYHLTRALHGCIYMVRLSRRKKNVCQRNLFSGLASYRELAFANLTESDSLLRADFDLLLIPTASATFA